MVRNKLGHFDVLLDDCLDSLADRLAGKVDVLICNPPYVETPASEEGISDNRQVF